MALSEYEQEVLAQMEQHLRQQDPALADKMASSIPTVEKAPEKSSFSPRRIAIGSIMVAGGLASILGGVSGGFSALTIILGVLGFLLMVGGILYALSSDPKRDGNARSSRKGVSDGKNGPAASPSSPRKTGADREEQRRKRWENRNN